MAYCIQRAATWQISASTNFTPFSPAIDDDVIRLPDPRGAPCCSKDPHRRYRARTGKGRDRSRVPAWPDADKAHSWFNTGPAAANPLSNCDRPGGRQRFGNHGARNEPGCHMRVNAVPLPAFDRHNERFAQAG